jgi:hypothetical protein
MGDWQLLQRNSIGNILAFEKEELTIGQGILFYTIDNGVSKRFMLTLTEWAHSRLGWNTSVCNL